MTDRIRPKTPPAKGSREEERRAREAEALRANLRRRKDQARDKLDDDAKGEPG